MLFLFMLIVSCRKDNKVEYINNYLHLSHTRTDANPDMDSIVETIDYSKFDMLWLGGDLASVTSIDDGTMIYVDSIFDLGNSNTLWSLGNHDYGDMNRIETFTNRPPFYAAHKDGITFIVLDTQESASSIIGLQKDLFESVVDTIEESSHLVLLHHKLIWMYGNADLEPQADTISNGILGDCSYCINPNNFYPDIYPKLLDIKQKGIDVICIAGDIGKKESEFEYLTPEGIYFLASGVKAGELDNKALLFTHDVTNKSLYWEYKLTSDLDAQ